MIDVLTYIDGEGHGVATFNALPVEGHSVVWDGKNLIVTAVVHNLDDNYIHVDLEEV